MKKLIILLVLISLYSCREENKENIQNKKVLSVDESLKVVEIDSCEYVIYDGFESGGVIHKGNCKYCHERKTK